MKNFDEIVLNASTKAELHRMIDDLPDDGTALLIVRKPVEGASVINAMCYPFRTGTFELIGQMEHVKHTLLSSATDPD